MGDFEKEKKAYLDKLYKPDFSKKGSVDEEIKGLVDRINSLKDYYTTSSCAGRAMLIMIPKDQKRKDLAKWLFVSHKPIRFEDLPLKKFPKNTVWLRQESMILHVCCRDLESAQEIIDKAKFVGFKRSGVMATKNRIIVEITGTEKMDIPITNGGKLAVTKNYLRFLANEVNKKMKINMGKMEKFQGLL